MGNLAAEYSNLTPASPTGTEYLSVDTLGSTRLITNNVGGSPECLDYLPFGEEIPAGENGRPSCYTSGLYPNSPDPDGSRKFTGKERDSETGLDWFGTRYMSSAQGRITSPDKPFADQDPSDPQSWNLYGYVRNNPLRLIDDDGEGAKEFLYGLLNATSTNAVGGIGRAKSSDADVRLGQKVGDTISLIGGAIETFEGGSAAGGGAAACATGVGCLAGAPAIAGGLALGAHGILTATTAANNLLSNSLDDAPSSSGSSGDSKAQYENPGHHDPTSPNFDYNNKKSTLPSDAESAYGGAVKDTNRAAGTSETYYAKGADGQYYRYQGQNWKVHWNGAVDGDRIKIPKDIKKQLDAK
jgi:RHS repeat-associated protein